jgi:hypothetical protein
MEKKKPRKNVNVKQNLNACIGHKYLTLSDVETPMMESFKHACMYLKHTYGMKVGVND